MLILQGVDISRLNREIRRGLGIVDRVYIKIDEELVITRTYEGDEGAGSLHYGNDAFNARFPVMSRDTIIVLIRRELGIDYVVVEEQDQLHVQYDPKGS